MRQGEIWNVYFNPVKGSEQSGNRPAVIINGNRMNQKPNLVIVCKLTTPLHYFKEHPIIEPNLENGLKNTSEILVFQVERYKKTVSKKTR